MVFSEVVIELLWNLISTFLPGHFSLIRFDFFVYFMYILLFSKSNYSHLKFYAYILVVTILNLPVG
jgi:hypothetical protein